MKTKEKLTGYGAAICGWCWIVVGVISLFVIMLGLAGMLP